MKFMCITWRNTHFYLFSCPSHSGKAIWACAPFGSSRRLDVQWKSHPGHVIIALMEINSHYVIYAYCIRAIYDVYRVYRMEVSPQQYKKSSGCYQNAGRFVGTPAKTPAALWKHRAGQRTTSTRRFAWKRDIKLFCGGGHYKALATSVRGPCQPKFFWGTQAWKKRCSIRRHSLDHQSTTERFETFESWHRWHLPPILYRQ